MAPMAATAEVVVTVAATARAAEEVVWEGGMAGRVVEVGAGAGREAALVEVVISAADEALVGTVAARMEVDLVEMKAERREESTAGRMATSVMEAAAAVATKEAAKAAARAAGFGAAAWVATEGGSPGIAAMTVAAEVVLARPEGEALVALLAQDVWAAAEAGGGRAAAAARWAVQAVRELQMDSMAMWEGLAVEMVEPLVVERESERLAADAMAAAAAVALPTGGRVEGVVA